MTMVIRTDRLDVRPWTHEEVEVAYAVYSCLAVARWLGAEPKVCGSIEAMHATIDRWAANASGSYSIWALVPRATGVTGGNGFARAAPGRRRQAGRGDRGRLGTASRPLGAWARSAGLQEVYAVVYPGNDPSVSVTQRLWMAPLGRTKRWYGAELDAFRVLLPEG